VQGREKTVIEIKNNDNDVGDINLKKDYFDIEFSDKDEFYKRHSL